MVRLYSDSTGELNPVGEEVSEKVRRALQPVLNGLAADNISAHDVANVVNDLVGVWRAGVVLRRVREKGREFL